MHLYNSFEPFVLLHFQEVLKVEYLNKKNKKEKEKEN